MPECYEHANLLLVSASKAVETKITDLFQKEGLSGLVCANSTLEAKRILIDQEVDLLIMDAPLPEEDAMEFVLELARRKSFDDSIIILANAEIYEKNLYQAERMGLVIFKKPMDVHILLQTIRLLLAMRKKIKNLESRADTLQQKLKENHLISRAKILLVANLKMSEEDAHYYIEKKAMDACVKKTKVAQEIIRRYESK